MTLKITAEVKSDTKALDNIFKRLETLKNYEGSAGFYGKRHPVHGVTDAQIAASNEYGDPINNIPERPFMRTAAAHSTLMVSNELKKRWPQHLKGKITTKTLLKDLSEKEAEMIKRFIITNDFVDNAAFTIAEKGFNDPLVNTGWLAENVDTKVRRKDG